MSKGFESAVCGKFLSDLASRGYEAHGCTFVRRKDGIRGTVWLVEGSSSLKDHFMPRLSVGVDAIGEDVAVLSRDLHQLVNPNAPTNWYPWRALPDAITRARTDLLSTGLPWLDQHLNLDRIVQALKGEQEPRRTIDERRWWQLVRGRSRSPQARVNLNVLRALSHVYELQGRYDAALDAWTKYVEGHTHVVKGSELDQQLADRLRALVAANANKSTGL